MGLDMYLYKRTYVGNKWRKDKPATLVRVVVPDDQEGVTFPIKKGEIKDERISSIQEEIAYWRKANQIHKWFTDNCHATDEYGSTFEVSREDLEKLLALCKKVKSIAKLVDGKIHNGTRWTPEKGREEIMEDGKYIENAEEVAELLPTEEGFFFGSTDYNEYYMQDIQDTIDQIEPVLAEVEGYGDFEYHASW